MYGAPAVGTGDLAGHFAQGHMHPFVAGVARDGGVGRFFGRLLGHETPRKRFGTDMSARHVFPWNQRNLGGAREL